MTILLIALFLAVAVVVLAVAVPGLLTLTSKRIGSSSGGGHDDGQQQAEHDLAAWRQPGRITVTRAFPGPVENDDEIPT